MNIRDLLHDRPCSCGKTHTCAIRDVFIEENALKHLPELVKPFSHILLAADQNTYAVCGERVKTFLGDKLENVQVFTGDGFLVPNEEAIAALQTKLTGDTDLIVGIGSGVMQDLCKYVSHEAKLPYMIVASAPSMDGYASVGAAMITGNMKVTYNAHVPLAIVGDVDILKDAPMDMIRSGYGDILGKYSCLNDWKLAKVVNGEYFCEYVYDLTYEMLMKTKDLGPKLLARDPEAVKTLMEALIGVGIAMAYVGNSRPASGSEHHLSHYFEVIGIMKKEPYFMHGTDVAYACVVTEKLREKLLCVENPVQKTAFDEKKWEERIRTVYADAAEGVIALQKKVGRYEEDLISVYREKWQEIKEVLREVPDEKTLVGYLHSVGLDMADFEKTYGFEKIDNAVWFAKDLKDRYSVLWLYYCLFYA